jgi:hypothetical protein
MFGLVTGNDLDRHRSSIDLNLASTNSELRRLGNSVRDLRWELQDVKAEMRQERRNRNREKALELFDELASAVSDDADVKAARRLIEQAQFPEEVTE